MDSSDITIELIQPDPSDGPTNTNVETDKLGLNLDLDNLPIYVPPSAPTEDGPPGETLPVPGPFQYAGTDLVPHRLGPILFEQDRKLWDRQPGEHDKAFACFNVYLNLGSDRSLTKAYYEYYGKDSRYSSYNPNVIGGWSIANRWVERVQAYDAHIEGKIRFALEKQRLQSRLATAKLGRQLREVAADALTGLAETLYEMVEVTDPVTKEVSQVRTLKNALSPSEIAKLADTGAKLERAALELDGGAGAGSGVHVGVTVGLFNQMVTEDIRGQAREVLREQDEVIDVTAKLFEGD